MPEIRTCPRCGNTIQDWAGGVCHVCARYENVYHKPLPKKRYGYDPPDTKPRPAPIPPLSQQCRPKLESFNDLLIEIYGQETHFSEILSRHGVEPAQLDRWRKDKAVVKQFLDLLEARLLKMLKEQFPHDDPAIWAKHYIYNWSIQDLAKEFRVSTEHVRKCCLQMIGFLRSTHGISSLEEIICKAASKLGQ